MPDLHKSKRHDLIDMLNVTDRYLDDIFTIDNPEFEKYTERKRNAYFEFLHVKYKRTDALSLWHQQKSTTVDIHGPLLTRGETRCPGGVSVSCLASRTHHECPRHNESVYMEA